ncbi:MAG: YbhB/YbcL family Raf kinase inhibitor-like protein [Euryarchaeota archaeon]|jgi:Raf kinase inhibitor-like YbhB/YbcL family protein|nr:YbhB/YbcL family Raf kinase inhibitor-like protein [Euryarchaeota archaeon]
MVVTIKSSEFNEGEPIPPRYTCDDLDISPPLEWHSPHEGGSWALICDDPDAPNGLWTHWVLFNIPPQTRSLAEHVINQEELENGARQGVNSWGNIGYQGPCPPQGVHHYIFKIYLLDTRLDLPSSATRQQVLEAMEGCLLDEGQLMGIYHRE